MSYSRLRPRFGTALTIVASALMMLVSGSALATTPPLGDPITAGAPVMAINAPTTDVPTTNDFMELQRDLTSCISSYPLPGCDHKPTSSSDRGGWQQLLLFAVMLSGMATIFWRVYRAVRKRDQVTT